MNTTNTFSCHDLYLAGILIASKKLKLKKLLKEGRKHIVFLFEDPNNEAEQTISTYLNRELKVIGLDLVEAIKQLKNRIYLGI